MPLSIISVMSAAYHYVQQLIFDPEDDPALRRRSVSQPLTPEQKERRAKRRKMRERLLRRQKWIIPDAKPPKKRKPCRSRKRRRCTSSGAARPTTPRPPKPPRVLKRQYKPLASEIYNLPAGLIDKLREGKINLRKRSHRAAAHKIADAVARIYIGRECMEPDEVQAMHDAIDRLASHPLSIPEQLAEIEKSLSASAEELQAGWSANHEHKANNYPIEPMVFEPLSQDDSTISGGAREAWE